MDWLFQQKPKSDPAKVAQLKAWIAEARSLNPDIFISVSQLACSEPGCPPIETGIAWSPDSRYLATASAAGEVTLFSVRTWKAMFLQVTSGNPLTALRSLTMGNSWQVVGRMGRLNSGVFNLSYLN